MQELFGRTEQLQANLVKESVLVNQIAQESEFQVQELDHWYWCYSEFIR